MCYSRVALMLSMALVLALSPQVTHAQRKQVLTNPEAQAPLTDTAPGLKRNEFQAGKAVAEANKIVQPLPLTAEERDTAIASIDRHLTEETEGLKAKLKNVLPDELAVLAKTTNWNADQQNALVVALRANDPAAAFAAWTQGSPRDTAGAEIVARQTEARRTFARLEQNVHNKTSIVQDLSDLETTLNKIISATKGADEVVAALGTLKTWAEVRKLVEAVTPDGGRTARLPTGKVPLIYDPALAVGKAIVLGHDAVLIGNQGKGPISIRQGMAAEALGMPIVTGKPVRDSEGQEVTSGVLLVNPPTSSSMISYTVEGNRYEMQPGMTQHLPGAGQRWTIEYDRGGNFGVDGYTVSDGTYYFTPTDTGWQLYKQRFDIVLDNSQNPQEFHYLLEGERASVPPNGTKTIKSIYPMVVHFDRANGSEIVAKSLNFSGNVQIGVNVADNKWDLFPTNENQRAVSNLKLFE
ncbi:MAG: hypothetical protein JNM18_27185 [Planctomycetaceae bacterium]|nr:hypothetical protein [Planctomycetaceae bacterium]